MRPDAVARARAGISARSAAHTVAWAAPVAAATALAFPSGGYFIRDWGVASMILLALLTASALVLNVSLGGRWGIFALSGLAGLAAWQGISSAWSLQPSASITAMNQTLLYAATFALVLIGVRSAKDLLRLLWVALAGSAIVTAYGLSSRLLPALVSGDDQPRLSAPITYWNGLGAIIAFGAVVAIGLAGHPHRALWTRSVAAALVPMFLLALLLTFSRGATLVLMLALTLLIALAPGRIETVAALITTLAVSIPLLVAANGNDHIAAVAGVLPANEAEGRWFLLLLLVTMAVSAAASAGVSTSLRRLPETRRHPVGTGIAALAIATLVVVGGTSMPSGGPVDWAQRQLDSFRSYDTGARIAAESVADRLAVAAGSGRWQNWMVAVDQFGESPAVGTGAGDYQRFWEAERGIDLTVTNAHSLYLEVLAESGLVGLLLLLLPLGIGVVIIARALHGELKTSSVARDVAVAATGATVVAIHAGGDWDWQLPAVVMPPVVLGAAALKVSLLARHARHPGAPHGSRGAQAVALGLASILGIAFVLGPTLSDHLLERAKRSAAAGDLARGLAEARRAHLLSPRDPSPLVHVANVLADAGLARASDTAFAEAVVRAPRKSAIFADWATVLLQRGDLRGARVAARRAVSLNPLGQRELHLSRRVTPPTQKQGPP